MLKLREAAKRLRAGDQRAPGAGQRPRRIEVKLGERSYPVLIGSEILGQLGYLLSPALAPEGTPVFVVSDPKVHSLYGPRLRAGLRSAGLVEHQILIPDGERYKNLKTVSSIYDRLIEGGAGRDSPLVALGGGVVGDTAGYAAATFMRGIPLVMVPTTLLAQVDSAIGGKVGVNHRAGKNLIGAFYQPRLVLADIATLESLPEREYRNALYEVIKYGVIRDAALFELLEREGERLLGRERGLLEEIVARCAEIKAEVVADDERESGLRMILNFGHTLGHALEAAANYRRLRHGEAVGWGMIAAARLARELRMLDAAAAERIEALVRSIGPLPSIAGLKWSDISAAMYRDKKMRCGRLRFVLPRRIGEVTVTEDVPDSLVKAVVAGLPKQIRRGTIHESL